MGRLSGGSHDGPGVSRYVSRTPEEEAELRNATMRERNPQRAEEIEWYAGKDGIVYLRDKPKVTAARTRHLERRSEQERAIWKANQRRVQQEPERS